MPLVFEFEPTADDLAALFNWRQRKQFHFIGPVATVAIGLGIILFTLSLLIGPASDSILMELLLAFGGLLVGLGLACVLLVSTSSRRLSRFRERAPITFRLISSPVRVEFSDAGVAVRKRESGTTWAWSAVSSVTVSKDYLLVAVGELDLAVQIPVRVIGDQAAVDAALAEITALWKTQTNHA